MKYCYLFLVLIIVLLVLNSCDTCVPQRSRKNFIMTASVTGLPDTIHINEKIKFQYIMKKDSIGISGDTYPKDSFGQLYTANGRDVLDVRFDMYFTTTNKSLSSYPYYSPDINYIKYKNVEYEPSGEPNGGRTYTNVYAKDEGDKYVIEYEVSFKDTGFYNQTNSAIQTIVCCSVDKCKKSTIGETEIGVYWPENNISKLFGYEKYNIKGKNYIAYYPIYVIP